VEIRVDEKNALAELRQATARLIAVVVFPSNGGPGDDETPGRSVLEREGRSGTRGTPRPGGREQRWGKQFIDGFGEQRGNLRWALACGERLREPASRFLRGSPGIRMIPTRAVQIPTYCSGVRRLRSK